MASGCDVTLKLYPTHVIERVMHIVNAINVLDVFCIAMILAVSLTQFHCFTMLEVCKQALVHT